MTDAARSPMMQMPAKRGLSRTEAAGYIGIGTTLFDKLVEAGQMPRPKRIGVRNVWDRFEVDLAFDRLSTDNPDCVDADANDWD
ncbi:MAG: helix-turn-helix transcriptional regulator [Gemmobacter sp.]